MVVSYEKAPDIVWLEEPFVRIQSQGVSIFESTEEQLTFIY